MISNRRKGPSPTGLTQAHLSRRQFLRSTGYGVAGAMFLAACGGSESATTTTVGAAATPSPGGTLGVSVWGGSVEDAITKATVPLFTERTGATVVFDTGPGGARANKLITQGEAAGIDVFINTEELSLQALEAGLIAPLDNGLLSNFADVPEWAKAEDWGVAQSINALGLIWHTGDVTPGLASWNDLWRPELKGKLSMPAITHSTMLHLLIAIAELNGGSQDDIEPGLAKLAELEPASTHFFWTGWAPLVLTGEVTAAVDFDLYGSVMIREDEFDVDYSVPIEGALPSKQMMSVVKSGNAELAHEFINAALDPRVQEQVAELIYQTPTNTKATVPGSVADLVIPTADVPNTYKFFDERFMAGKRQEWTELMNQRLGAAWQ